MIKELEKLSYFTLAQFSQFFKNKNIAKVYIFRYLKMGKIVKIRQWIYVWSDKLKEINFKGEVNSFIEFIATNLIYSPSYLSLESVLFSQGVIIENVYNLTLVSLKKTALFKNKLGIFSYRTIKKEFFADFEMVEKDGFVIYQATVEKALFDYFYFKKWIVWQKDYFVELRLNLNNVNFKKFEKLVKKYKSKKLQKVFIFLKELKNVSESD